ncbi:transmembrane adipocyte-associated 1 homolog [Olea europaea subsp. europaea]|uniref:Transmembrane adipocyte-associated 1 homolog n=1 Tax=Olea europaea subsp. europaea TaxID=158383 RepID=A0A8S0TAI7_OLEEU|nr:transmembrane adipocyte-associated 1 homolog [Olea europaea subsp. europaea]
MSTPNITLSIASTQNITDPSLRRDSHTISKWYNSGSTGCTGFWRDAALVVPSVLFVLYLGFQARRYLKKLSHRRSYVMISYYALIWFSVLLNLAWSFLQAIFIFGFGVPLFIDGETTHRGKWGVWFTHTLVLAAAYGYIAFVHYSKWRDKLPPRPAFYNYVILMFIVNVTTLFACGLAGIGAGFGLWLYNFIVIVLHSLYLPFLYIIFLADFFQEEDWLLDNAYYSEMKDAGFFDTDWD